MAALLVLAWDALVLRYTVAGYVLLDSLPRSAIGVRGYHAPMVKAALLMSAVVLIGVGSVAIWCIGVHGWRQGIKVLRSI